MKLARYKGKGKYHISVVWVEYPDRRRPKKEITVEVGCSEVLESVTLRFDKIVRRDLR